MLKLVIYTLVGSLLMLTAAVATGVLAPGEGISFALSDLRRPDARLPEGTQDWIFLCFAAAFLVKMPAFPLHGWMPDGYRAMPLPVLAVFSGVLSKVAAYGFLRIALPLFPDAARAVPGPPAAHRAGLDPVRIGGGLHHDGRATRARLLVGRPARLHRAGDLRPAARGRAGRAPPGRQPRPRGRTGVLHRRAARRARGRQRGPARHGRAGHARAGAHDAVPDRGPGQPGHARVGELRRRVLHPARRLQREDRHRDRRLHRRGAGQRLHPAAVHPRDAQPPGPATSCRAR